MKHLQWALARSTETISSDMFFKSTRKPFLIIVTQDRDRKSVRADGMGTIFKIGLAFCIGAVLLHFAHRVFLQSISAQVAAAPQPTFLDSHPVMPTMNESDAAALRRQLTQPFGPIDTTAGARAGVENAARQGDLIRRRAESAVPLPPRY
jgi:hypothetical protein